MENNFLENLKTFNFNEFEQNIKALCIAQRKNKAEIIKTGILTNIAYEMLPNYKNYKTVISGITKARMIKGVNSKRNHIDSQINKILEMYELSEIGKDILNISLNLLVMTFDSVFTNSGDRVKKNYRNALKDINFLYVYLKLAVKIIAETLRSNNIDLTNMTLQYMTDSIKREKSDIIEKYVNAYSTGDENAIMVARENYREKMERMLNNYYKSINYPHEHAVKIGEEYQIVDILGKDFFDSITLILLEDIKLAIEENNFLQLSLNMR